uniref:NifQ family protein n=1 Tax=uncultured bacterium DX-1A-14 TaxID=1292053 RepID=M1LGU8_9BACT|nr:NifQ family protein [uncultured bacterium DX-1A-14]
MPGQLTAELVRKSRFPDEPLTVAFAGTIARALESNRRPLIRGLPEDRFQRLMRTCFPGISLQNGVASEPAAGSDEFDDLLHLLRENAARLDEAAEWLAYCIASASMAESHLWQDMGLPNRRALSHLFLEYFPALSAGNTRNMKWKKFLYRKLCERAGVPLCRAPRCADCIDYDRCFGPEDEGPESQALRAA